MIEKIELMLSQLKEETNESVRLELLNKIGGACWANSNLEEGMLYSEQAYQLAKEIQNRKQEAVSLTNIAIIHAIKGSGETAIEFMKKALHINEEIKDTSSLIGNYSNLGSMEYSLARYEVSLNYLLKALKLADAEGHPQKGRIINNLGNVYTKLQQYDLALKYHKISVKEAGTTENDTELAGTFINIGNVYRHKEDIGMALGYYKRAMKLLEVTGYVSFLSTVYNNIANIYMTKKKNDLAIEYLRKSIVLAEKNDLKQVFCNTSNNLAAVLIDIEDYTQAKQVLDKAIAICFEIKDQEMLFHLYETHSVLCMSMEDYKTACKYKDMVLQTKSKIFSDQLSHSIAEMQTKYESEKKEREAELYRLKNIELVEAHRQIGIQKEELELNNYRLQELDKSKDSILNIVSHDLKNSISGVMSVVDLMRVEKLEPKIQKYVTIIDQSNQRAIELVNAILNSHRMEMQDFKLDLKLWDMVSVLQSYEQTLSIEAQKKNILINFYYPSISIMVELNIDSFWQIVNNLVTNAIKFTHPSGCISIALSELNSADGRFAVLKIKDNGIGIPSDNLEEIFRKFTKAGRKGTQGENSTGLGLSIVKRLVELHKGNIRVESEPENGSTFIITLPIGNSC